MNEFEDATEIDTIAITLKVTRILMELLEKEYGRKKARVIGSEKLNNNDNLLRTIANNRPSLKSLTNG